MRKDSATIFIASIFITTAIVGGFSYLHHVQKTGSTLIFADAPSASDSENSIPFKQNAPLSNSGTQTSKPQLGLSQTSPIRTDTPIECPLPDGSTFWTNVTRCEDADLENRISRSDPVSTFRLDRAKKEKRSTVRSQTQKSRTTKPNLRGPGRAPPGGLKPECRFPVGMALEKERLLAASDDPLESIYRKSYCRFRTEALRDECPVYDDYYRYKYNKICWDRYKTDYQ